MFSIDLNIGHIVLKDSGNVDLSLIMSVSPVYYDSPLIVWRKRGTTMILLIIILILVFGGGGGYYGHTRWGPGGGACIGLGTILVILLIAYLLGLFR